jgi:transposase
LEEDGGFNHVERRDDDNHEVYVYKARLHGELTKCPLCSSSNKFTKSGYSKATEVKLPTTNGYDNRIILQKQRYECHSCGGHPVVSSPDLDDNRNISRPLRWQVLRLAMEDISEKLIAFILRLSHSAVHRIINEELANYRHDYSYLPTVMSFDEVKLGGEMTFTYTSPEGFGEILPNRQLATIKDYFYGFSYAQRQAVEYVIMDMNANYARIIPGLFPNARIIIDRFHIIQQITQAINTIRRGIQNLIEKHSREYKIMKNHWRLFITKYTNLEKTKRQYLIGLNEYMTQEEAITLVFKSFPILEAAWYIYQEALEAIDAKSEQKLHRLIESYKPVGSAMDLAIGTFKRHLSGILESLRHPYSNGQIEGFNRRIKQIAYTAYGFRNPENALRRVRLQLMHKRLYGF